MAVAGGSAGRPIGRRAALALTCAGGLGLSAGGLQWWRAGRVREPLRGLTVARRWDGTRVQLDATGVDRLVAGSRVLEDPAAPGPVRAAVDREREWLAAGTVPGRGTAWEPMARYALLDLATLMVGDGALVAGWPPPWRYVWPRDASFAAAALAATGHAAEALSVLEFLQRVQDGTGRFQARYLLDGSGPPDDRGIQLDGSGWVLWSAGRLVGQAPAAAAAATAARLRPMLDRSVHAILSRLDARTGLPPPSPDYWEVRDHSLTLGTAAPLLAGLHAAADIYHLLGEGGAAGRAAAGAQRLDAAISAEFGPAFARRARDHGGADTAVVFLLPPVGRSSGPDTQRARVRAARELSRPGGGLGPGTDWKRDGISWTPETAMFALASVTAGDHRTADRLLGWLDRHRTAPGSLPEKVLHDGSLAGPAPLAWTAAVVLLTLDALEPDA